MSLKSKAIITLATQRIFLARCLTRTPRYRCVELSQRTDPNCVCLCEWSVPTGHSGEPILSLIKSMDINNLSDWCPWLSAFALFCGLNTHTHTHTFTVDITKSKTRNANINCTTVKMTPMAVAFIQIGVNVGTQAQSANQVHLPILCPH